MAVIVTAIAALVVPEAFAARAPSANEHNAISKAVKSSPLTAAVPDREYAVRRILVSTVGPYARGEVFGVGRYRTTVQEATVLLRQSRKRWRLVDIGSYVRCSDASRSVLRNLRLHCI